jgi:hypothetical protein
MVLRAGCDSRRGTSLVASRMNTYGPGVAPLIQRYWRLSTRAKLPSSGQVAAHQRQVVLVDPRNRRRRSTAALSSSWQASA